MFTPEVTNHRNRVCIQSFSSLLFTEPYYIQSGDTARERQFDFFLKVCTNR